MVKQARQIGFDKAIFQMATVSSEIIESPCKQAEGFISYGCTI